jgi:hypothetical protein
VGWRPQASRGRRQGQKTPKNTQTIHDVKTYTKSRKKVCHHLNNFYFLMKKTFWTELKLKNNSPKISNFEGVLQ